MKIIFACFFLAGGLMLCILPDYHLRDAAIYLIALSTMTILPAFLLKPPSMDLLAFLLLTPVLFFSLDALMLRMGWYCVFAYFDQDWFPALREDSLRKAAGLILVGNVMLWLGYAVPMARSVGERLSDWINRRFDDQDVEPDMLRVVGVYCLSIVIRLYSIVAGFRGYFSNESALEDAIGYSQFLLMAEGTGMLALLLYGASLLKQTSPRWGLFAIMLGVEFSSAVLLGFKGQIAIRFFYLGIVYAAVRRRCPRSLVLVGFLSLVAIYPINQAMRRAFNEGNFEAGDLEAIGTSFWESTQSSDGSGTRKGGFLGTVESIARASNQMEPFAMVVQYVDETGTRWYGVDYLYPITGLIPRYFWPDKPSPSHGHWVYNEVYGLSGQSAQPQTVPGDFYLNFGWVGTIVGLFVLGMAGRVVGSIVSRANSILVIPLFPYVVQAFGMLQSNVGAEISGLSRMLVFYSLCIWFLTTRRAREGTAPVGVGFSPA